MDKLEKAKKFYARDRFATDNGAAIVDLGDDFALCSMNLTEHHKNSAGRIMGGAIFTLADFAFAVAATFQKEPAVTSVSQITFLSAVHGNILYAKAHVIRRGKRTIYLETDVTDNTGVLVARVSATGQILSGKSNGTS